MKYVGVDLHKQLIVLCVVELQAGRRKVVARRSLRCGDVAAIHEFLSALGPFQIAWESTAAYEWFAELAEPLAERMVLVHPRKMRIIAESRRKTDKLDAQILAEFLAADELPQAWRPTPRVRQHRTLVRQRDRLVRRMTSVKNRLRNLLARYNADKPRLFNRALSEYVAGLPLNAADRFVVRQLLAELAYFEEQRQEADRHLAQFAGQAPVAEQEIRKLLDTIPGMGPVTIDVVLAEIGDIRRFRSQAQVVSFAGLDPGVRASAGRSHELGISKQGSRLLRWAMIELAWRLESKTRRWGFLYENLKRRCGPKKAIVAVARRILCVIVSMWKSGRAYRVASEVLAAP
jgi:transposase